MKQKNLLFIFADQWRASALGYAKSDPVITPNMDRFCEEAVYYENACSSFPLCSPHRASLFTGRYPLSTGVFTNCKTGLSMRLSDDEIGIGEVLKVHGYHTGYIGKWHLDEPELNHEEHPASGAAAWDAYTPPGVRRHGFDYWYSYGACDSHLSPHYWRDSPEMIRVQKWSPEHETDAAIDYINERKNRPFALYLSWNPPHSPYEQVPEKYRSLYGEIGLRPNVAVEGICHHTGESVDYTEEELVETTKQYYGAISGLDEQFGRLVEELKRLGLYENTVIVLSADHGDMMGSHGLMGKHVWYDESVNIPLVIRVPGCDPRTSKTCIGSQDMMPTVLGLLGVPIPDTVEGADCSFTAAGEEDFHRVCYLCACPGREEFLEAFKQAGMSPVDAGWRGVRTGRYTYVMDSGYEVKKVEQRHLYDNRQDPYQCRELNLEDPANKAVAEEMEAGVVLWLRKCKDTFRMCKEE